jgi:hypothetical protein
MNLNPEFVRSRHLEREHDAIHEQLGTPRWVGPEMESELLAMEAPRAATRDGRWSSPGAIGSLVGSAIATVRASRLPRPHREPVERA